MLNIQQFYNKEDPNLKKINFQDIHCSLGMKGARLVEMFLNNFPVPPGFTITTKSASLVQESKKEREIILREVKFHISKLENIVGKFFGDDKAEPLLFSVRSGAAQSMPGMLNTIPNIGLNDNNVKTLALTSKNEVFAYDCYMRLIEMYGEVVLGIHKNVFHQVIDNIVKKNNSIDANDIRYIKNLKLTSDQMHSIIEDYKIICRNFSEYGFPQDPNVQLEHAIDSIFNSWNNERAIHYRKMYNISNDAGTAATIQQMVYGNLGDDSCTGVLFTRNPSNGENVIFGEYIQNAQGEDIVSGSKDAKPIFKNMNYRETTSSSMEELFPECYIELVKIAKKLEKHYFDMQDIEFTVEKNKLWILQTRSGKRSGIASLKIAHDLIKENQDNENAFSSAVKSILIENIERNMHSTIDNNENDYIPFAKGLAASPGAVSGSIVFTTEKAEMFIKKGFVNVILLKTETSPDDIIGMSISSAFVTARGGMTSHAAVVARGMGKPCICSVNNMFIDEDHNVVTFGNVILREGDIITIDGSTGDIFNGVIPQTIPQIGKSLYDIIEITDKRRRTKVYANAETNADILTAFKMGAEGIGLCRTEHMFFEASKINDMQRLILSISEQEKEFVTNKILNIQTSDFMSIFQEVKGKKIIIRLLDPPLHEFLPKTQEEIYKLSLLLNIDEKSLRNHIERISEINPMLGLRGCRVGLIDQKIYKMQIEAIFQATQNIYKKDRLINYELGIMIPFIFSEKELIFVKNMIQQVYKEMKMDEINFRYKFGAMIELPRAVIKCDEIAQHCDFISFGTNDLTQTALGLSRDDSYQFINHYIRMGIIDEDPFVSIDEGVVELMKIAIDKARASNKYIEIGICGEHAGDFRSIYKFIEKLNIDYISCSPLRIQLSKIACIKAEINRLHI